MNIQHAKDPVMQDGVTESLTRTMVTADNWDLLKHSWTKKFKDYGRKQTRKKEDSVTNLTNRYANILKQANPDPVKLLKVKDALKLAEDKLAENLQLRSGERWIEQGERSSKYFFQRYKERLHFATIPDLIDNHGQTVSDAKTKVEMCRNHLQTIWEGKVVSEPDNFPWYCPTLPTNLINNLAQPFTEQEILESVRKSPRGKAPGPDRIPSEFYFIMKEQMVPHLTRMFNGILTGDVPPHYCTESVIVQIPKKTQNIELLSNWRPSKMENYDLKILRRATVNRFQVAVRTLVNETQTIL